MSKLDQTKVPVKCPACNRSLDPTVQAIYSNRHIRCGCGSEYEVGMSEANALRQSVQKQESATVALQQAVQKQEKASEEFKQVLAHALSTATIHLKRK